MEVRILQSIASQSYSYAKDQTVEVSKERADEFIRHAIAEPITEKATKKAPAKKPVKKKGDTDDVDDS